MRQRGAKALELYWQSDDEQSRLYHGDAFELMASIPDDSVDCVWTDPPTSSQTTASHASRAKW